MAYAWFGVAPEPVVPSPNAHAYADDLAVGIARRVPLRPITAAGGPPASGPAFATGGRFVTVIVAVSVSTAPSLSTTVSVAVYVPAAA